MPPKAPKSAAGRMQQIEPKDMNGNTRILLVEDNPGDAALLMEQLKLAATSPFDLVHVAFLSEALKRLESKSYDIVLLDLDLPDSNGLETVSRALGSGSEAAIVLLTGLEDTALGVEAVKKGAQDYLVKGQVAGSLLFKAIRYSIERKRLENERQRLVHELKEALSKVKLLSGLIPICANCKKIRDDAGYWNQIEVYLQSHSEAEFTHGICPACVQKLYPELGKPPE